MTPKKEYVPIILANHQNRHFLTKWLPFFFGGGGHFWKNKSPGGLAGTNPGVLETQISAKNQSLKTVWSFFVKLLKFVARSSNVVALTIRCGSRYGSPGIDCLEK